MKKNLLVTLGCSMTEGVGCYDMSRNLKKTRYFYLPEEEKKYQENEFHTHGWPNRVGKKLGFDKVINLGLGGSANSHHAKTFLERVPNYSEIDDYNVYVIWLQTAPTRISFYDGNKIRSFIPYVDDHPHSPGRVYLKYIDDFELGSLNEQVFYSKVVEQVCENNGYKLIHIYWSNTHKELMQLYDSPYNLFDSPNSVIKGVTTDDKEFLSPVCGHPNHKGYEKIANFIVDGIDTFRPEFRVGKSKETIEWEWRGSATFDDKLIKGWNGWAPYDVEKLRTLI